MRLRVFCGWSDTIASLVPTMRLSSVDLPALGRPMRETKPLFMAGSRKHRVGAGTFFPRSACVRVPAGVLGGHLTRDAHAVDPPPLDLEHLNREPVDLEPLADRGPAPDAREQVAAERLEALTLDLDAEPLRHL